MIVKEIVSEQLLTMPEVKEILNKIKEDRIHEEAELGYELRKALRHAENFTKLAVPTALSLLDKLKELEKMRPEIAVKIVDILPQSVDEIRSVYAKERFTLTEDELKRILNLITEVTGVKTGS